jgi:hypothetical protein
MQSRHLLPINSILFYDYHDRPAPRPLSSSRPQSSTLANLQDAQDLSITALPQPPTITITTTKDNAAKESIWKRFCAVMRRWLCMSKEVGNRRKREMMEDDDAKYR